jgi:outer membrane protein
MPSSRVCRCPWIFSRKGPWFLLAFALLPGCVDKSLLLQPDIAQPALVPRAAPISPSQAQVAADHAKPLTEPKSSAIGVQKANAEEIVPVFSLGDAIAFGLQNSPRLRIAREAIARAQGQEQVAFAPFLPELNLYSRIGIASPHLSPGSPGPVGGLLASTDGSHSYSQAEVDLQWTVYDFGRTSGQYGQAVSRERITVLQLARAQQTVAFDVASAYLNVLLAQASKRVQTQSVRQAESILEDARVRRKGGVADPDDVLRAEVQLSEARETVVTARQLEFDSFSRLGYAMGRNVSLPMQVIDWQARPPLDMSLLECVQIAAAQRDEVAIAREAVAGARFGLETANGDYLPRIYIRMAGGHVDGSGVLTGWQEGAAIHLDQQLYAGSRRQGNQRAAEADIRAAMAQTQGVFDSVSLEVNLAYRAATANRERIPLAETAIKQARENMRLVTVKYKNGNATPTDIVDAQTALTRSEQRYYFAIYDYLNALARLEFAMGTPQGYLSKPPGFQGKPEDELPQPRPIRP